MTGLRQGRVRIVDSGEFTTITVDSPSSTGDIVGVTIQLSADQLLMLLHDTVSIIWRRFTLKVVK